MIHASKTNFLEETAKDKGKNSIYLIIRMPS